jgi:hypothetical protein
MTLHPILRRAGLSVLHRLNARRTILHGGWLPLNSLLFWSLSNAGPARRRSRRWLYVSRWNRRNHSRFGGFLLLARDAAHKFLKEVPLRWLLGFRGGFRRGLLHASLR